MPDPTHILHLTERPLWDTARVHGTYRMSKRGRTLEQEGFIHCSTRAQLPAVAPLSYGSCEGPDELAVLVVDPARLEVPVKHESSEAGAETFPHVHGPIPVDAVVEVEA